MVDTVATQVIADGPKNTIMQFTNESDGTGETDVIKVDLSNLSSDAQFAAPLGLRLKKIIYSTSGFPVKIEWAGTPNKLIATVPENHADEIDFCNGGKSPGLKNDAASATGDILFSTLGVEVAGDSYSITLYMTKVYV